MPKKLPKKRRRKNQLLIISSIFALFVWSLYSALNTGTGPLSYFLNPISINKVIEVDPSTARSAKEAKLINQMNTASTVEGRTKKGSKANKKAAAKLYVSGKALDLAKIPGNDEKTTKELEKLAMDRLIVAGYLNADGTLNESAAGGGAKVAMPVKQGETCDQKYPNQAGIMTKQGTFCGVGYTNVGTVEAGGSYWESHYWDWNTLSMKPYTFYCCAPSQSIRDKANGDCPQVDIKNYGNEKSSRKPTCQVGKSNTCVKDYYKQHPTITTINTAVVDGSQVSAIVEANVDPAQECDTVANPSNDTLNTPMAKDVGLKSFCCPVD